MAVPRSVRFEPEIPLLLRVGTITHVDVIRPDTRGRFPGLLQRTPYDKSSVLMRTGTLDAVRAAVDAQGRGSTWR